MVCPLPGNFSKLLSSQERRRLTACLVCTQGSIISAIAGAIEAVIMAVVSVIMAIVDGIVWVRHLAYSIVPVDRLYVDARTCAGELVL